MFRLLTALVLFLTLTASAACNDSLEASKLSVPETIFSYCDDKEAVLIEKEVIPSTEGSKTVVETFTVKLRLGDPNMMAGSSPGQRNRRFACVGEDQILDQRLVNIDLKTTTYDLALKAIEEHKKRFADRLVAEKVAAQKTSTDGK